MPGDADEKAYVPYLGRMSNPLILSSTTTLLPTMNDRTIDFAFVHTRRIMKMKPSHMQAILVDYQSFKEKRRCKSVFLCDTDARECLLLVGPLTSMFQNNKSSRSRELAAIKILGF